MRELQSVIRLITFDLDDTLWPCHATIMRAEEETLVWLQQHAPEAVKGHDVSSLRTHRAEIARKFPDIAHDMTELRLRALKDLFAPCGYSDELAEQASDFFRVHRNRVEPYPEVVEALQRLKTHYTLVSVTNGNAQVDKTPLKDCFHLSLDAAGVGAAKPDPAIFHAACEFAGVSNDQVLHVGDDPFRDMAAATRLGIHSVWVNRSNAFWPIELPRPQWQVADMQALADALLS